MIKRTPPNWCRRCNGNGARLEVIEPRLFLVDCPHCKGHGMMTRHAYIRMINAHPSHTSSANKKVSELAKLMRQLIDETF